MKIELNGLDQTLYYEKLNNGLEIYLLPFHNKKNYMMSYVTKFGSLSTEFIPYNKDEYIKVPDGIAHFLEHKMFEQEDGIDPFEFASKSGTYANAATNFDSTKYFFEGNKNFKENLDFLLDFVGKPYFTDENVNKEKGIIGEEIKQYDDDVNWFMEKEVYKSLLHNDNHRIDIAGSIDSISKITKEDLYDTYYTFYQPSNMFIVITGNFDVDEALDIIRKNKTLNSNKVSKEIRVKEIEEPDSVHDEYKELEFNINDTKTVYSIKIPIDTDNIILLKLYVSMMLDTKFGISSLFREELKKKDMFTRFNMDKEVVGNHLIITFFIETDKSMEIVDLIKEELKDLTIDNKDLERLKKVWIASLVMGSDDVGYMNEVISNDIIKYNRFINNKVDITRSLNMEDYNKYISNLDLKNDNIVIIKKNV